MLYCTIQKYPPAAVSSEAVACHAMASEAAPCCVDQSSVVPSHGEAMSSRPVPWRCCVVPSHGEAVSCRAAHKAMSSHRQVNPRHAVSSEAMSCPAAVSDAAPGCRAKLYHVVPQRVEPRCAAWASAVVPCDESGAVLCCAATIEANVSMVQIAEQHPTIGGIQ